MIFQTYFTSYKKNSLSHVQLFVTPWTVADQAPPSMGFSRQEYWSGLPFHSPGDLPNPGIEPRSPALQADSLPSKPPGKPRASWQVPYCGGRGRGGIPNTSNYWRAGYLFSYGGDLRFFSSKKKRTPIRSTW